MKTFKFYQDIKCTIWRRQYFEIEAENVDEAKRIAMKFRDSDAVDSDEFERSELDYDTEELMLPSENGGQETIQLYLRGEEYPFATNGTEENKCQNDDI